MSAERAPRRADCLAEMRPAGEKRGREGGGALFSPAAPPTVNERALIAASPTGPLGVAGVSTQHVLLSLAARARAERDEVVHEVGLGGIVWRLHRSGEGSTYDTSVCDRHVSFSKPASGVGSSHLTGWTLSSSVMLCSSSG